MNEIECAECGTSIETEGGVNRWVAHAFADRMGWKSYRVENEWKVSCPSLISWCGRAGSRARRRLQRGDLGAGPDLPRLRITGVPCRQSAYRRDIHSDIRRSQPLAAPRFRGDPNSELDPGVRECDLRGDDTLH